MPGSYLSRSWEVSSAPAGTLPGRAGKGNRNPAIHADEKSDIPIVPKNSPNNGCCPAEVMEGRGIAAGKAFDSPAGLIKAEQVKWAKVVREANIKID